MQIYEFKKSFLVWLNFDKFTLALVLNNFVLNGVFPLYKINIQLVLVQEV
jgi:hypothetical protein